MKILAFDCSSKTMCVAVSDGEKVLAAAYSEENRNHAPFLMPLINRVMAEANISFKELELIGVTIGPGSFTGLRIGIATAKGLSDTLDIPMIPIFSLDALALGFAEYRSIIVPMLDARKNQVYAAVYDNRQGKMEKLMEATPLSPVQELAPLLKNFQEIIFVGDALPSWGEKIQDVYGHRCVFVQDKPQGIAGESLVKIASAAKSWELTRDITPYYIRGVDAKAKFLRCSFKPLVPEDLDELLLLEKEAFDTPWTRQMFLDELANTFAEYWVIRIEGKLAAYGGFWHIANECHVTNIAVHPDYRHLGLGTLMVEHILNRSRELGVMGVTLEVRPSNTQALRLYEKTGFHQKGVRPHYYEDNGEDAIIMWHIFADNNSNEKPWSI